MPKPQGRDPAKENHWRRLLCQWRRSGLTGRSFCAEQGLSEASFYGWRREIARRDQENLAATKRRPIPPLTRTRTAKAGVRAGASIPGQSDGVARPAFLKLAMAGGAALASPIDVVLSEGRLLRVHPGFDVDLLRQLLQVLEESSC